MDQFLKLTKRYGRSIAIGAIVVIIVATIFFQKTESRTIAYQINEGVLGVGSGGEVDFIQISDIVSAELVEEIEFGESSEDSQAEYIHVGEYQNKEFGPYRVYASEKTGVYIVVNHLNGVLVFNSNTVKATEEFYGELLEAIEQL